MERDYWYTVARVPRRGSKAPKQVGTQRRGAGAAALESAQSRDAESAGDLRAAHGAIAAGRSVRRGERIGAIYRHASFLAGKLGEKIASEALTVIDDATMPGLFGSSPFDDEGVASRRTVVIERGVLKSYLLNTYSARKLGLKTTGNASRGITGQCGRRAGNFYIEAGDARRRRSSRALRTGSLRHRTDRRRRQYRDRRLFLRRGGPVDRERRTGVSCFRDHHRGKSEADADGRGAGRVATWSFAAPSPRRPF